MKRGIVLPAWAVACALGMGLILVLAAGRATAAWWVHRLAVPEDPLAWIHAEFQPSPETMAVLRQVHGRYAVNRSEITAALEGQRRVLVEQSAAGMEDGRFREESERWDALIARSHALTWEYVMEMAGAMPADQARRFRQEMVRTVLGLPSAHAPTWWAGGVTP